MKTKFKPFDAADYLADEETIAEYLTAALEDSNPDMFPVAVRDVARARHDATGEGFGSRTGESVHGAVARIQAAARNHPEDYPRSGRQTFRYAAAYLKLTSAITCASSADSSPRRSIERSSRRRTVA